jgi:hypothetical protein
MCVVTIILILILDRSISLKKKNSMTSNDNDYQGIQVSESKFWRKVKQDPVVPIGMIGFGVIVLGAIIGFNRRDRSKPTSTYWIRTRVFAQGFVVCLLTSAAVYQAVTARPDHHDIHGHKIPSNETKPTSTNDHQK